MSQEELRAFFVFCEGNLLGFVATSCDESAHYYLDDECIGGYAGDRQELFFKHSDVLARALRMYDAYRAAE